MTYTQNQKSARSCRCQLNTSASSFLKDKYVWTLLRSRALQIGLFHVLSSMSKLSWVSAIFIDSLFKISPPLQDLCLTSRRRMFHFFGPLHMIKAYRLCSLLSPQLQSLPYQTIPSLSA